LHLRPCRGARIARTVTCRQSNVGLPLVQHLGNWPAGSGRYFQPVSDPEDHLRLLAPRAGIADEPGIDGALTIIDRIAASASGPRQKP